MTDRPPLLPPPPPLAREASLYLDFDGTLVDIAPRPEAVVVAPRLPVLIAEVARRLDGRVAFVSGRSIDALTALLRVPGVAVSGSHGIETMWADGTRTLPEPPPGLDQAIAAMHAFAAARPGVLVEEKPFGAALHYRAVPAAEPAARALVTDQAAALGLQVQTGKMVVELRIGGVDKGDALRRLQAEVPYRGHRPVFVGDDDTDEPAFTAAAALGGHGILVGPIRATAACYRLDDVAAVHRWLEGAT